MKVRIFVAEPKRALSSGLPRSSFRISLPWSSCRMSPAVTMGPMPRVMRVPWLGGEDYPERGEGVALVTV